MRLAAAPLALLIPAVTTAAESEKPKGKGSPSEEADGDVPKKGLLAPSIWKGWSCARSGRR